MLVASDTKGPFLPARPDENTLQGTEKAINGITEEKNPGQNDDGVKDDPKKTSEASTSKLEKFQEKLPQACNDEIDINDTIQKFRDIFV